MNLMFVCTGNTCRSPMAEALAAQVLFPAGTLHTRSAGIAAFPGQKLSPMAALVLQKDFGIDSFEHFARNLTYEDIESADLVIAMTRGHKRRIEEAFGLSRKIIAMPEEIPDPYGGTEEEYRLCADAILAGLKHLVEEGVIHD